MIRKILKVAGLMLLALIVAGAVLFAFGLRIELDGGGTPRPRFIESEEARLEALAKHRQEQRKVQSPPTVHGSGGLAESVVPASAEVRDLNAENRVPASAEATADRPASTGHAEPRVDPPAPYWTDFRGPVRDGHYRQRAIRTDWPAEGLKPLWQQPVGGGYASFVIANGRAFTIEQRGEKEVVAAYDVPSGRELWTDEWQAAFRELMGGDGPRATPTWHAGQVYALGAQGELRCLDEKTGRVAWRTNILEDAGASNLQWGMAASPLIVDDFVIVVPGGPNGQSVAAYDRRTGKRGWSAQSDQAAYSSPMLVTLAGVRQIVVFSATRVMGLSPDSGALLWEFPWKTQFDIHASQPLLIGDNRLFVSSGYGTGGAVIELTKAGDKLSVREVWRNIMMKNQFSSSVLHDGFIYGLDEAILACVDAATGERKWKGGRYGYGQVMLAGGHLIVLTEEGDLALVRATPEGFGEVARFPVLDGKTWNHPAMADGYLLVRNLKEMAAFDLRR